MSFSYLYQQSNGSLTSLRGKVVKCSVDQVRGNKVLLKTGLKHSVVCFQSEFHQIQALASPKLRSIARQQKDRRALSVAQQQKEPLSVAFHPLPLLSVDFQPSLPFGPLLSVEPSGSLALLNLQPQLPKRGMLSLIGIEHGEQFGEPKFILPKRIIQLSRRKLVWTELTTRWRGLNNHVKGFVLNSVNGGYAVAIAGYIAFLPRSLRITKTVFTGQWRLFSILNMNARLRNIVVKEIRAKSPKSYRTQLRFPTSASRLTRGVSLPARLIANANVSLVEAYSKHKANKASSQRTLSSTSKQTEVTKFQMMVRKTLRKRPHADET